MREGQVTEDEMFGNGADGGISGMTTLTADVVGGRSQRDEGVRTGGHALRGLGRAVVTSAVFEEFLRVLGQRITLKGWTGYRGGLDTERTLALGEVAGIAFAGR